MDAGPKLEPEGPRVEVGFPTADHGFSNIQGTHPPDLSCEVQNQFLQVVDLKQEVPDLRSGEIPHNLTPGCWWLVLIGDVDDSPRQSPQLPARIKPNYRQRKVRKTGLSTVELQKAMPELSDLMSAKQSSLAAYVTVYCVVVVYFSSRILAADASTKPMQYLSQKDVISVFPVFQDSA